MLSAWDPVCDFTFGPPHAKPLRGPGSCTFLSRVPPHNLLHTTVNSRLGRSHSCSPSPGGGAWAALVHKEVTAAATVFRSHDSPGCLGWDMAREADPMPTTRAAQRDSVQGQGARRQTEGERTGRAGISDRVDRESPLPRRARPAPGLSREMEPSPRRVRRRAQEQQQDRSVRGRAVFPSVSRTGSAAVAVVAAAQESGHHGCLYYPPSNSNFFPSLLTNYPASVLISFYYWN